MVTRKANQRSGNGVARNVCVSFGTRSKAQAMLSTTQEHKRKLCNMRSVSTGDVYIA